MWFVVDIDECESEPCHDNADCLNDVNGFRCLVRAHGKNHVIFIEARALWM